jgi:legumain
LAILGAASAANWAVVVAGSNQYYNYRHQADVCHAYQTLHSHGIPNSNIITLFYDDIANDPQNPYPGQLFNKPTDASTPGVDVYKGCQKDYTGNDVTAQNFLYVITGNASAVQGAGDGRVLKSGPDDNVFIFFSDHGGTGIIAFPVGPFLQATDLNAALEYMSQNKMYKKLVFYLEACESGSMFQNLLPPNINIYATSASSPDESSWGCYCPPDDMVKGVELNSCLGDLYSVNWMEDADKAGSMKESLQTQFQTVQQETTQSHVMQWGETDWTSDAVGKFEGGKGAHSVSSRPTPAGAQSSSRGTLVDSRDAKLHHLYYKYVRATRDQKPTAAQAAKELQAEIEHRAETDKFFRSLARTVAGVESMDMMVTQKVGSPATCGPCCAEVMETIRTECGGWSDYALKYTRVPVNLCHLYKGTAHGTSHIVKTVKSMCSAQ